MRNSIIPALLFSVAILSAQEATEPKERELYRQQQTVQQLKRDMDALRDELRMYQNKVNLPALRQEIKKMVDLPVLRFEVLLKNGTVIQGDIIQENMDQILFKTQIGELTLQRSTISSIKEILKKQPKLSIKGAVEEQTYPDKKVFSGTVINEGDLRADFVRILFLLFEESTTEIARDSSFVLGSEARFSSGVYSISSVEPGGTAAFRCEVPSRGKAVGYYTTEIHFETLE